MTGGQLEKCTSGSTNPCSLPYHRLGHVHAISVSLGGSQLIRGSAQGLLIRTEMNHIVLTGWTAFLESHGFCYRNSNPVPRQCEGPESVYLPWCYHTRLNPLQPVVSVLKMNHFQTVNTLKRREQPRLGAAPSHPLIRQFWNTSLPDCKSFDWWRKWENAPNLHASRTGAAFEPPAMQLWGDSITHWTNNA